MDALSDAEVKRAMSLIDGAKLPYPLGPLLQCFVMEALDPRLAARYILEICNSSHDKHADLLAAASHWRHIVESVIRQGRTPRPPDAADQTAIKKRDGGMCCITGQAGHFWDPLVIVPILPVPTCWTQDEPRTHEMLGAFFSPPYRDWWFAYARSPESMNPLGNHWLVRKSAARGFSQGLVRFDRLHPSMVEYKIDHVSIGVPGKPLYIKGLYPLLGDHSRSGLEKVDPRLMGTHARLTLSIQWLDLADDFALNEDSRPPPSIAQLGLGAPQLRRRNPFSVMEILKSTCIAIWVKFPARARVATYKLLRMIGTKLYGESSDGGWSAVQRLPFGLYLKYNRDIDGFRNEFNALKMVRHHTTVPVPRPIDLVSLPSEESTGFLLMTRLPGTPLSSCQEIMSDRDGVEFAIQMQEYISQLRAIPKTVNPNFAICNTLGEACRDTRLQWGDPVGPFVDEAAFSQLLRNPDEPSRRGHEILFTHADLNARNILVDRITQADGKKTWKVTGIVDWENSGYYPEYWDYTRSLYEGFRYSWRWCDVMHEVFKPFGDYSKEFEVEKRSWEEGDYI
ncbi:kinase-like domain-containing protein [Xylariaceae sp. FL0662B]|nr:kinase-like domain-containing protein [Xylariaceae sp. FL0662B]